MPSVPQSSGRSTSLARVGVVFVGPIIGLPPSLIAAFSVLRARGAGIEGVDIFEGQVVEKSFWKILGLTALPGSHARRVSFANRYDERRLFENIVLRIEALRAQGKTRIILGGMSGGFIFASRLAQVPPDEDTAPYAAGIQPSIKGIFGVSPFIFYPAEVLRDGAELERVPPRIPVSLVWGDADTVVPMGTVAYAERVARDHPHIVCRVIRGSEVGARDGTIRHQFFGGRDFVRPFTNAYWNPAAERIALGEIMNVVELAV
jgi:hypothetical protein